MRACSGQQNKPRKGKDRTMNKMLIASLFALSLATGFTCSKNAPEQTEAPATTEAPAEQAQMAAPADAAAAPTEAAPTDAAAPAAPASTETH